MEYVADTNRLKWYVRLAESVIEDEKGEGAAQANPQLVGAMMQVIALERLGDTLGKDLLKEQRNADGLLRAIRDSLASRNE